MWTQVVKNGKTNERKWELKRNDVVLATIYKQAKDGKFSLYISSPVVYRELKTVIGKTYQYNTFEEAQQGFVDLVREKVLPWCGEVIDYFREIDEPVRDNSYLGKLSCGEQCPQSYMCYSTKTAEELEHKAEADDLIRGKGAKFASAASRRAMKKMMSKPRDDKI